MKKMFDVFLTQNQILSDEPMKNHTSFKTGGKADLMLLPKNTEEVKKCIDICVENNFPYYIMGNGSNLLVSDLGFRGVVIKLAGNFSDVEVNGGKISAQAGATLSKISAAALKNSLKGFEFASGIPGTAGGAVCMNAGAYGFEMKDIVKEVTVINNGDICVISNEDAGFRYRGSKIADNKMVVLKADICLENGSYDEIYSQIEKLKKERTEKQPINMPSAGSTFKRPANNFAGKLIMDAGLSGFSIGDAQVSPKHCGFIVNKGGASTADILLLIDAVKKRVYEKFGVMLEEEVKIIGEFID